MLYYSNYYGLGQPEYPAAVLLTIPDSPRGGDKGTDSFYIMWGWQGAEA